MSSQLDTSFEEHYFEALLFYFLTSSLKLIQLGSEHYVVRRKNLGTPTGV